MIRATRSLADGLWTVARAPALVAGVLLVTLASVVPFGLMLGTRLQTALANQPPVSRGSGEIDPEWWLEFRAHATGLEATFTPTVIGFAAPLDNLSALLDGTPRPLALAGPVALGGLVWAFLWGAILHRFSQRRALSIRECGAAAIRHGPRLVVISLAAALVYLALYLTVHAWLFGPVYEWLASQAASERNAFVWRVGLYAVFGVPLAAVSLMVDYARVALVTAAAPSLREAFSMSRRFVGSHLPAALTLYLLVGILFVLLLTTYGAAETFGGTRFGGWRGILLGQAYIVARLCLRLVLAASEVRLFTAVPHQK